MWKDFKAVAHETVPAETDAHSETHPTRTLRNVHLGSKHDETIASTASACLRLYCGAGKIDAFAAMLRAAPSARLPVRMHFGIISNANVTESSFIRKERVLACESRAQVVCLKYSSVAIVHGAEFGNRARWLETVLVVCARRWEGHRWGMRAFQPAARSTISLALLRILRSVPLRTSEAVAVKCQRSTINGLGASHRPSSGSKEQ
jgi:hypothetical protein